MRSRVRVAIAVLLALAVILASIARGDPHPHALYSVAVVGCTEPHARWAREAVEGLSLPRAAFVVVDSTGQPAVTVACVRFPSHEISLARYRLGSGRIEIDPARISSLFGLLGVLRHELIHWRISRGPHPERATLHVCAHEHEADSCWSGGTWPSALMAPSQRVGTQPGLDGAGPIAVSDLTIMDLRFYEWAVSR